MINTTLNSLFEDSDKVEVQTQNQCMNCGASLPDEFTTKCEICGYDSSEEFTCPYKIEKEVPLAGKIVALGFCELTRKQCKIRGLDYEVCTTFRSLDTLKS